MWFGARAIKAGGAALLAILNLAGGAQAAPLDVQEVRVAVHSTYTRVVLEMSGPAEAKIFGLTDPYRIVLDLPEARWPRSTGESGGLVALTRWAAHRPGVGRLVLDLSAPALIRGKTLVPPSDGAGWRLILDLAPATKETFGQFAAVQPPAPRERPREVARAPAPSPRRPVVVIDPGHGGADSGTVGANGVLEKDLVLDYARSLREALQATGRFDVVLTRETDIFLPLRARIEAAHAASADLFISLHVDSEPTRSTRGLSIYVLSENASDAEAAALAAKENKADIIAGVDLGKYSAEVANILIDFAQAKTNEMSVAFAREFVLPELGAITLVPSRPLKGAGFAVLKLPDVPSILVELGYLSHAGEEKTLLRDDHRRRVTQATARAVDRYFTETRQARRP